MGVGRHRHRVPQLGEQFQIKKMIGFINQIQHVSKSENQSKLDSLHELVRIRERLVRLLDSCDD